MRSASSSDNVPLSGKLREGIGLAYMHLQGRHGIDLPSLDACVREYEETLLRHGRTSLRESTVLEIGFGARPLRLVWLYNAGVEIWGVDLDKPLLHVSANSFLKVMRQNGAERAIKSAIRYYISDAHEWNELAAEVGRRGRSFRIPEERLAVADAASAAFWESTGTFDFIYSEDVFEHVLREDLPVLVERMAGALRPDGIALIRPMVFTGICGGHHLEWYPHTLNQRISRRTEPWEHLRQDRFPANTYLNRLRRQEYVDIFEEHFQLLEEEAKAPRLGAQFMTDEIRAELVGYSDYELFSNSVRFILKRKHTSVVRSRLINTQEDNKAAELKHPGKWPRDIPNG